jgi:hypothetical protein
MNRQEPIILSNFVPIYMFNFSSQNLDLTPCLHSVHESKVLCGQVVFEVFVAPPRICALKIYSITTYSSKKSYCFYAKTTKHIIGVEPHY